MPDLMSADPTWWGLLAGLGGIGAWLGLEQRARSARRPIRVRARYRRR